MLDFVRDIYTSFRQTSIERVKSPFLGAFVFSWLGFNWQMLSILFFSKKDIEQRLEIINKAFDIGDYLLAPIFTTTLIVILLPQINKLITKIQDKPNSDTVELSLSSKIRIAELQQSIAEIEAKKRLADKKEERHIEEGIDQIKNKLEKTILSLNEKNKDVKTLMDGINDLTSKLASTEGKLNFELESRAQIQRDLSSEKEKNNALSNELVTITTEISKYQQELSNALENNKETLSAIGKLKGTIDYHNGILDYYAEIFPEIFEVKKTNDKSFLSVRDEAKNILANVNKSLKARRESQNLKISA